MDAPAKEEVSYLFNLTLQQAEIGILPADQTAKLMEACEKILNEFPADDMRDHIIAALVYLRYIQRYPELALP